MQEPEYLLVRHLGRSKLTRTIRATRPGMSWNTFTMEGGVRIRSGQTSQVGVETLLRNIELFLEGVEYAFIEVATDQHKVLSLDDLRELAKLPLQKSGAPKAEPEAAAPIEELPVEAPVEPEGTPEPEVLAEPVMVEELAVPPAPAPEVTPDPSTPTDLPAEPEPVRKSVKVSRRKG